MDLSVLSSQKPSVQSNPILVDAHGNPCKVNVQAVELEGRPRLIRALRSSGALVVGNAKDADIILVDPSTEIGRRLIRMWGMSPSKVVLQQAWAKLSIEAGRPLLQMDGWGGMRAIDDGLPVTIDGIVVDEEQEVGTLTNKSPLPTPRITPDDASVQKLKHTVRPTISAANSVTGVTTQSPPMAASPGLQATSTYHLPSQYQSPQPSLLARDDPSTLSIPPHLQLCLPQTSFSNTAFNVQPTSSFPSLPQTFAPSPEAFGMLMTMFDIIRHTEPQGQPTSGLPVFQPRNDMQQQSYVNTVGPLSNGNHYQGMANHIESSDSQIIPYPRNGVEIRRPSWDVTDAGTSSFVHQPHLRFDPRQSSSEVLSPSISRKRSPAIKPTRPPKRANKGKGKATQFTPPDFDGVQSHSDAQIDPHNSYSASPPEPTRIALGQRGPGEIFVTEGGQPLHFFVQVDHHKRVNVVSNIKKNKGKIVNNIPDADYVIASSRAKSYGWLLKEATTLDKIPIQATFVTDCIDECALLDEIGYALETDTKVNSARRRKQYDKPRSLVLSRENSKTNKKISTKVLTSETRKHIQGHSLPVGASSKVSPSPLPPPPETRKRMTDGRYYFTTEEDEYICQFAQYHFTQDPSMPMSTLMQKLHEKMPHHSLASWHGNADRKLKGRLEDIRKKAGIAKRKNTGYHHPNYDHHSESGPSTNFPVESSEPLGWGEQAPTPHAAVDPEEEDFDIICEFFASGGGDDADDERVWQQLAKFKPCRTAKSWPEYYAAHQEAVYARIEQLMTERANREAS